MRPGERDPFVLPAGQAAALLGVSGGPNPNGSGQSAGIPGQGPPPPSVHLPGGDLLTKVLHPMRKVVEQLYRVEPEESWYNIDVSPSKLVTFELGALQVPSGLHYWLFDYEFQPFRFSGVDPGDAIPVEEQRLGAVLGWDLTLTGRRPNDLLFQLDPIPAQLQRTQFNAVPTSDTSSTRAPAGSFNRAAFTGFAANSSAGLSLLPQRTARQGPLSGPFTIIAKEGDRVALSCVIFRPVPLPLAWMQGRHAGYWVNANESEALLDRVRAR